MISLQDDSKKEWIKWVKFGLNHPHRMKAVSELTEEEKPKPCNTSSTAQGGGGSFKNRKPIGEIGCFESGMAERSH